MARKYKKQEPLWSCCKCDERGELDLDTLQCRDTHGCRHRAEIRDQTTAEDGKKAGSKLNQ